MNVISDGEKVVLSLTSGARQGGPCHHSRQHHPESPSRCAKTEKEQRKEMGKEGIKLFLLADDIIIHGKIPRDQFLKPPGTNYCLKVIR